MKARLIIATDPTQGEAAARIVEHLATDPGVMVVRCHARELPALSMPSPVDLADLFAEPWSPPARRHRSKKRRRKT